MIVHAAENVTVDAAAEVGNADVAAAAPVNGSHVAVVAENGEGTEMKREKWAILVSWTPGPPVSILDKTS